MLISGFTQRNFGISETFLRLNSLLLASGLSTKNQKPIFASNGNSLATIVANPDALVSFNRVLRERIVTAFWAWELPHRPSYFDFTAGLLDEVWTPSKFITDGLHGLNDGLTRVRTIRLPVPLRHSHPQADDRFRENSKKSKFKVLITFDPASDVRRKNPEAAIGAFLQAFPEPGEAELVVKINSTKVPETLRAKLDDLKQRRTDITTQNERLSVSGYSQLLSSASVLISLHRAEGYGINLADAMARKVPVIATGYSGNLDFMDKESSILVPYELVPVNFYAGLPIKSVWAEPDIDFAARRLRELFEDEDRRREIAQAGFKKIVAEHSLPVAVDAFQQEFMNG